MILGGTGGVACERAQLDGPIAVGAWTPITLVVSTPAGLLSTFDLCLGHLPDDINGDGDVTMADASEFGTLFSLDPDSPRRDRIDLNGDGQGNLADANMFGQLWHGTSGHQAWGGRALPPKP